MADSSVTDGFQAGLGPAESPHINRLLDGDFDSSAAGSRAGKLTSTKYAALTKCSQDTALRDILQLVESGILVRNAEGGRSTSYARRPAP